MKHPRLPEGTVKEMLKDEAIAASVERALSDTNPRRAESERWGKYAKAGTYTLADWYGVHFTVRAAEFAGDMNPPMHHVSLGAIFTSCGQSIIGLNRSTSTTGITCSACEVSEDYIAQVMEEALARD